MRIRTVVIAGIALGLLMQYTAQAQEESSIFDNWTVTTYGNDNMLGVRAGVRPWEGRTELGVLGFWMDGLQEGDEKSDTGSNQQESWGGGIYGTYDVVQDAEFTVLSYQVPIDIYVGGQLGALHRADSDEDATAALLTGMSFGDAGIRLGVEYQYALTDDLWKELAPMDDKHHLFLTLGVRF
jgi:hypothetical protein